MVLRNAILLLTFGVLNAVLTVVLAQDSPPRNRVSALPPPPSGIPKLPLPSGPFGIGRIAYEWTDASRSETHSPDPEAHRDLMVYLSYPSPKREAGRSGEYLPGAKQMNADSGAQSAMKGDFETDWPFVVSGAISSHAMNNAPIAKDPARFPLVIFSHGNGGTSFGYTSLIEELVSHGFVVATVEHTYTAEAVVFPDGRIVTAYRKPSTGLSPKQALQQMMKEAGLQINTGADDLIFVMNKLSQLNNKNQHHFPLSGRLDLNEIAAMGHSSGGANAALACQLNDRFKACLSLEGQMPPITAFPTNPEGRFFTQPVLLLEVDHSGQRRGFNDAQNDEYLKKKEEQLNRCPAGSYDVLLKSEGLVHGSFSDFPLLIANGRVTETKLALDNLRLTESYILAFLDKYLEAAKEPLLDDEMNNPDAIVKRYGRTSNFGSPPAPAQ